MSKTNGRRTSIDTAAAILWTSAFLLAAIVIIKAGELPGNPAYAEMAVAMDDVTLVTASSGRGGDEDPHELLYVVDSRSEMLLVYDVENVQRGGIVLREGRNLPRLFAEARP